MTESDNEPVKLVMKSNSFSGHERNRLYMRSGDNFADLSLVSGADCLEDGRTTVSLDFDNDGWLDFALVSLNAPRFRLFRNRMSDLVPHGKRIGLRLTGAYQSAAPVASGQRLSNRDAIGAKIKVISNFGTRLIQKSLGEGFASQNSGLIWIGIPDDNHTITLEIVWPSGKKSPPQTALPNQILMIHESP